MINTIAKSVWKTNIHDTGLQSVTLFELVEKSIAQSNTNNTKNTIQIHHIISDRGSAINSKIRGANYDIWLNGCSKENLVHWGHENNIIESLSKLTKINIAFTEIKNKYVYSLLNTKMIELFELLTGHIEHKYMEEIIRQYENSEYKDMTLKEYLQDKELTAQTPSLYKYLDNIINWSDFFNGTEPKGD